jgi:hypothetical protein
MAESLDALEARRAQLLDALAHTGDMRPGSIAETYRRCGKPRCCCAAADHAGHGPYYAYTRKVGSKTKTIQLRPGPRLSRFEREVATYRQFRHCCHQLVELNERICDLRAAQEPSDSPERTAVKKTSPRSSRKRSRGK